MLDPNAMSGLERIPIAVDSEGSNSQDWGNTLPILHEVRHGLKRLAASGEPTLIDLGGMPFGPGDEERLLALLGRGEVQASLEALGDTRIWEASIPAVWLVDHRNGAGERIALHIEITRIPAILCTQPEDIQSAADRLDQRLASSGAGGGLP
jgi:hydrogenase-1 operon protein HyaF